MCENCDALQAKAQTLVDQMYGDPEILTENARAVVAKMSPEELKEQAVRMVLRDMLLRSHTELSQFSLASLESSFYGAMEASVWGSWKVPGLPITLRIPVVLPRQRRKVWEGIHTFQKVVLSLGHSHEYVGLLCRTAYRTRFDELRAYAGVTTERIKEALRGLQNR